MLGLDYLSLFKNYESVENIVAESVNNHADDYGGIFANFFGVHADYSEIAAERCFSYGDSGLGDDEQRDEL